MLRTFVDVMRAGSFAAVARGRNVAPSSVSRTIAALEDDLGVRLLHRTTRKVVPTQAAIAYYELVAPLLDELDRAREVARDTTDAPRGTLRISAPMSFAARNVMPWLPELSRTHPELHFELLLDERANDLAPERIDVAFRIRPVQDRSLIAHRLCDAVYVACAAPGYLERAGRPRRPGDLTQHDCLRYPLPEASPAWRFRHRRTGRDAEAAVNARLLSANFVALRHAAVAGLGITVLPRWEVVTELAAGALVPVLEDWDVTLDGFDSSAWLVFGSRTHLPRRVRAFVDFAKKKFRHGAPAEVTPRAARARG
jgi:DNA-binding transcriptional LysR family regulator